MADTMLDLAIRESMGDTISLTEILSFISNARMELCRVNPEWLIAWRNAHNDYSGIHWESFVTPLPFTRGN